MKEDEAEIKEAVWTWSVEALLYCVILRLFEVFLYVHRYRRFIRDGSPGRPPRLSHSSRAPENVSRAVEDVTLVEFMYLTFTRMPHEGYRRRLRSLLLYLYYVFRALINSFVC